MLVMVKARVVFLFLLFFSMVCMAGERFEGILVDTAKLKLNVQAYYKTAEAIKRTESMGKKASAESVKAFFSVNDKLGVQIKKQLKKFIPDKAQPTSHSQPKKVDFAYASEKGMNVQVVAVSINLGIRRGEAYLKDSQVLKVNFSKKALRGVAKHVNNALMGTVNATEYENALLDARTEFLKQTKNLEKVDKVGIDRRLKCGIFVVKDKDDKLFFVYLGAKLKNDSLTQVRFKIESAE